MFSPEHPLPEKKKKKLDCSFLEGNLLGERLAFPQLTNRFFPLPPNLLTVLTPISQERLRTKSFRTPRNVVSILQDRKTGVNRTEHSRWRDRVNAVMKLCVVR